MGERGYGDIGTSSAVKRTPTVVVEAVYCEIVPGYVFQILFK